MTWLALGLLACMPAPEHGGQPAAGSHAKAPLSFVADIQPLLDACERCHGDGRLPVLLTPDVAYEQLVDAPSIQVPVLDRVDPGNVAASYLVDKLRDTHIGRGGMGERMPPGNPWSEDDIATVERWIAGGALP